MKNPSHEQPILVTGGCGFIGSNLTDAIAARGMHVVVLDNFSRAGASENAAWLRKRHGDLIQIVTADVRDPVRVASLARNARAVLHLAAQVAVTDSLIRPMEDFETNARGTLNVLEAIRQHNPTAPVLFASTNKVYGRLVVDGAMVRGDRRYVPANPDLQGGIGEATPLDFYSPYGCSKGAADQYVHDYARVFGLRTVVMRMSCIYGPRQFGTEDQGWLAHFMRLALRHSTITIFGDGFQVRDALHVSDAVAAWLAALEHIGEVGGRVFNLGGGPANTTSLLELIDEIGAMLGHQPLLRFAEWRPGDQPWYVSNLAAVTKALDWTPRTPLQQGLVSLRQWLELRFGAQAGQEVHA